MESILVVDDEPSVLTVVSALLQAQGYNVTAVREGEEALRLAVSGNFQLLVSDIFMTPLSGLELLKKARAQRPDLPVIMLTAYGSVETAIQAMRMGAFDYVTKPFKPDEFVLTVKRALAYMETIRESQDLKTQFRTRYRFDNIVAESDAMKKVCGLIERVAPTDQTVLIYGESGTGKELVAKAIHAYSRRKGDRFLAVNCAALPEPLLESEMFGHVKGAFTGASTDKKGLFEAVAGGTLLLDEIGSMPAGIQGKLLRVLQEKEVRKVGGNDTITVDCRVLAATNTPLEERMKSGSFREDLFYRLSVISITIDPLRNRRADILPLAHHIIRAELGEGRPLPEIAPRAAAILEGYAWPGNVRELENAIKHALTFSTEDRITPDVLPPKIATGADAELFGRDLQDELSIVPLKSFLREKEEKYVEQVLAQLNGDKEKAAALLGISLATLYRKIPADRSPATAT